MGRGFSYRLLSLLAVLALAGCRAYGPVVMSLSVSPTQLTYSTLAPSPPVDQTVQVTNTGGIDVTVSRVSMSQINDLTLPVANLFALDCNGTPRTSSHPNELAPGECASFIVRYTPTGPESVTNTVNVESDAPGEASTPVEVSAVNTWPPPVCPNPPVASIQATTNSGLLEPGGKTTPGSIFFSSANSMASGSATISGQLWSLVTQPADNGEAMTTAGANASLVASTEGAYEVSLSVIDSNGCTSPPVAFSFSVDIPECFGVSVAPTAVVNAFVGTTPLTSAGVLQETTVSLDGSMSLAGSNPIATYSWSLVSAPPDNTSAIVTNGSMASIDCSAPGTYQVKLVVTDTASCASSAAIIDILVSPLPLECGPATEFIYVIDSTGLLYQFSPSTESFKLLGQVTCPGQTDSSAVCTMAVDRNGIAWVEYWDTGSVYRVDPNTLNCFPSGFNPSQAGSPYWGSTFDNIAEGSASATYYIQEDGVLASIDTRTLLLSIVGTLDNGGITSGELSGTPAGQLYGFFPSEASSGAASTWTVAELDRTDASIISSMPLQVIDNTIPNPGGWAFASWGKDFWFFVDNGEQTDVFHYDAAINGTVLATQLTATLDGAGVSPCVQLQ